MIDGKRLLDKTFIRDSSRDLYSSLSEEDRNFSFDYGFLSFFSKKRLFNLLHNSNNVAAVMGYVTAVMCHYILVLIIISLFLKELLYIIQKFTSYILRNYIHSKDIFDMLFTIEGAFMVLVILFLVFAPLINMYVYDAVHKEETN